MQLSNVLPEKEKSWVPLSGRPCAGARPNGGTPEQCKIPSFNFSTVHTYMYKHFVCIHTVMSVLVTGYVVRSRPLSQADTYLVPCGSRHKPPTSYHYLLLKHVNFININLVY